VRVSTWVEAQEAKQEIIESMARYKAKARKSLPKKPAPAKAAAKPKVA
jgi:hypothetical protein